MLTVILLLSTIFVSLFIDSSSNESESLDSFEIDVKNEQYVPPEYINLTELPEEENLNLKTFTKQIRTIGTSEESSYFSEIYTGHYVNPANNTVFIYVKGNPLEAKEHLMTEIVTDKSLTVVVRKSDYTLKELRSAKDILREILVSQKGESYRISSLGESPAGKMIITLVEVNSETVSALLDDIPPSVPNDMLVIRQEDLVKTTGALTAKHRPIVA